MDQSKIQTITQSNNAQHPQISNGSRINMDVHKRMFRVMQEVESIEKTGYNSHSNYHYIRAVDVVRGVKKLLIEHRIGFSVQEIEVSRIEIGKNIHCQIKSKAVFFCVENPLDKKEVIYFSASSDRLDKDIFKAKTNGLKYMFIQEFLIDSEDGLPDVENDSQQNHNNYNNNNNDNNNEFQKKSYENNQRSTNNNYNNNNGNNFNNNNYSNNNQRSNSNSYNSNNRGNNSAYKKSNKVSESQMNYIMQLQNALGRNDSGYQPNDILSMDKKQASNIIEQYKDECQTRGIRER